MKDLRVTFRAVGEFLATLSVVASLGFVALQVRQNTAAIKAAAIQDLASVTTEYLNAWATDDDIPMLFARVASGELPSAFSVEEDARLTFMYVSAMRAYEARYLQIRLGVLDEEIVESMSGASAMFDDAWFAEKWPAFNHNVGLGFAQFMEERYDLPKGPVSP